MGLWAMRCVPGHQFFLQTDAFRDIQYLSDDLSGNERFSKGDVRVEFIEKDNEDGRFSWTGDERTT